ncbi:MAG: type I-G CRISPR-associated protein Csb2 [Acidimicrobiia bacterium]
MSVTIGISFPWGRYHATPWGRHVNEGVPEWPPSPWRVLRTLVATWKNRLPDLDETLVVSLLEKLTGAPAYALPPHIEFHTRHYMPDEKHLSLPTVPGKTDRGRIDKILDPFVVVPADSEILICWDSALTEGERRCLGSLVARITYLGRAESVCHVRLVEDPPEPDNGWVSVENIKGSISTVQVLVPADPLDLGGLTERPNRLRQRGYIDPPGSLRIDYPRPEPTKPTEREAHISRLQANSVRFVLATPARPSRRAAVAMGHVLRQACMSAFGTQSDVPSPTLAGKTGNSMPLDNQHAHAHYLGFCSGTDPRLDTMLVWAPGGLEADELRAIVSLNGRELGTRAPIGDFRSSRLGVEAFGDVSEVAPELVGPSTNWSSFTPFSPTHHTRKKDLRSFLAEEVTKELGYRHLPPPISVEVLRGDWLSFRRHRPSGRDRVSEARRAYGLMLTFAEPVRGPIAIGGLSHFGLGLFLPVP